MKITKEESVAEELIKLIKAEYINMNNEFQSTKFRIDHPAYSVVAEPPFRFALSQLSGKFEPAFQ